MSYTNLATRLLKFLQKKRVLVRNGRLLENCDLVNYKIDFMIILKVKCPLERSVTL